MLNDEDFGAILLTLQLASLVTVILLLLGTPIAWWLAHARSRWKGIIGAVVALPLVLPPAVLGFYLLVLMDRTARLGQVTKALGLGTLPFTFGGLVVASVIYLPFVVQPLQNAFEAIGTRPLEVAGDLCQSAGYVFQCVVVPLARSGLGRAELDRLREPRGGGVRHVSAPILGLTVGARIWKRAATVTMNGFPVATNPTATGTGSRSESRGTTASSPTRPRCRSTASTA